MLISVSSSYNGWQSSEKVVFGAKLSWFLWNNFLPCIYENWIYSNLIIDYVDNLGVLGVPVICLGQHMVCHGIMQQHHGHFCGVYSLINLPAQQSGEQWQQAFGCLYNS